jgi:hypothetical protein
VTAANTTLVAQVRQAIDTARQEGRPAPGRPTLVRLTGATDHAVRKALTELATVTAPAGEPEAVPRQPSDAGQPIFSTRTHQPPEPGKPVVANWQSSATSDEPPGDASAAGSDQPTPRPAPGGRLVAWTGFIFGSVMSIAANVLHAWLPAAHQPPGWSPGIAPQIGAAVWPIGLMLAVEALSRIHWPKGFAWGLARYGGAGTVALGSAVISYGHLRDLLLAWQYAPPAASVGPLVLDGLMIVSGFALLARDQSPPTSRYNITIGRA